MEYALHSRNFSGKASLFFLIDTYKFFFLNKSSS
jgi:hypothetical protein